MIKRLLILMTLLILQNILFAQSIACSTPNTTRNKKYLPPKLIDQSLFKSDLRSKLNLKDINRKLLEQKITGFYGYNFKIDKNGAVIPVSYAADENRISNKNVDSGKIISFFKHTFNKYKWKPGYEVKNKANLSPYCLQLSIFFEGPKLVKIFIREIRPDEKEFVFYDSILL